MNSVEKFANFECNFEVAFLEFHSCKNYHAQMNCRFNSKNIGKLKIVLHISEISSFREIAALT